MTKTIKEVLEELWWHGERYGTGTVGKDELSKEEALNQAVSEIEKIMDGVIGEDDDTNKPYMEGGGDIAWGRNKLRTTQRQSLKEVLGE